MGGLPRRTTALEQVRALGPTFVVDGGDLGRSLVFPESERLRHRRARAGLVARVLADTAMDAMVPGEHDLRLGVGWYFEQVQTLGLPVLAANLSCPGRPVLPGSRIVEHEGIELAFVGVVGPELAVEDCTVSDPVVALQRELAGLAPHDLLVVVSHAGRGADAALARAVPAVDLVVQGHGNLNLEVPQTLPGRALLLATEERGTRLGVARITLMPGADGFAAQPDTSEPREVTRERFVQRQVEAARDREASAPDSPERAAAERKVAFYAAEVASLDEQLRPGHQLANRLVSLDASLADSGDVLALVRELEADLGPEPPTEMEIAHAAAGLAPEPGEGVEGLWSCSE